MFKFSLILFLLAPWLMNSCGQEGKHKLPIVWSMECNGEDKIYEDQKEYIRDGFKYWNDILGEEILTEGKCGEGVKIYIARSEEKEKILGSLLGLEHYLFCGSFFNTSESYILIKEEYISSKIVIRHEIGHLLGLNHNKYPKCLMHSESENACGIEIESVKEIYDL